VQTPRRTQIGETHSKNIVQPLEVVEIGGNNKGIAERGASRGKLNVADRFAQGQEKKKKKKP